jgi:protein-disulfide isomerase
MHRYHIALIAISMAAFLVLFIFFLNIFQQTPDNQPIINVQQLTAGIQQPTINLTDPVLGEKNAINTIAVYGDFLCPYSKQAAQILQQLTKNYPEKVKIVWKDFPNTSLHPAAMLAAQSAHCAGEQNKFWEYHDYLFENQDEISPSLLTALADELKLDKTEFINCLQTEKTRPKVESNLNEARALKLDGTPTLFINGTQYQEKINYESLEEMIK